MPRFRRLLRWMLIASAGLALLAAVALGALYYVISSELPDISTLRDTEMQEPLYVHAADGKLMAVFGESRRYPVTIDQVPCACARPSWRSRTPASTSTAAWTTRAPGEPCG